jgi:nucleoside-diphosphate-sugar epimerase
MILITGGHGFLGQATAQTLVRAGHRVAITRYRSGHLLPQLREHVGKAVQIVDFDVREPMAMIDAMRRLEVKRVIHLASGHWSASLATDFHTNTAGLIHLLEAARQAEVERITVGSSITVYFGNPAPYRENDPLSVEIPDDGPGLFKRVEEQFAQYFMLKTGIDVQVARITQVYGPGYRSMRSLISRVCAAAAMGGELRGPLVDPVPDYAYVDDIAAALAGLVTNAPAGIGICNLGSGVGVSKEHFLTAAEAAGLNAPALRLLRGAPEWSAAKYMLISKAKERFNWAPQVTLEQGMRQYVELLRAEGRNQINSVKSA